VGPLGYGGNSRQGGILVEPITRRLFLVGATGAVVAACGAGDDAATTASTSTTSTSTSTSTTTAASTTSTTTVPPVVFPGDVFTMGVASGDPLTDRVILWTRLAVDPSSAGGAMGSDDIAVTWEVAVDGGFSEIVSAGSAVAEERYAHSVHADADGLEAGQEYFFRFRAGNRVSPVGRTRTLPSGAPDRFRFALTTCQDPQTGEYGAWRDIAARDDIEAVIFTGDYIYETPPLDFSPAADGRRIWNNPAPADLDGFRLRYAKVKGDPGLQAAHAAAPWFVMWDDHEITDNYWSGGAGQFDFAGGDFITRRTAAYQAWWEHQPVRLDPPVDGSLVVYRSARVGDLVEFFIVDTRQYADEPPCRASSRFDLGADCVERDDPGRSLLGAEQEAWLLDGLGRAETRWTSLVSPSMFSGLDARTSGDVPEYYLEAWDGYTAARNRIADELAEVSNPVVLSGDYHASFALDVGPGFGRDLIAPEFMSTAISSAPFGAEVRPNNPHVRHFAGDNGYLVCSVDADTWTVEYRTVTDVWDAASPVETTARFVVDAGRPEMRRL
jgi:alkaline phosphatase D